MKVTRIAYSAHLNAGKWEQLAEQARRLGVIRSAVWRRYGSINGVGVSDRSVRDQWMADGTASGFTVLANAWKETVRDAVADIAANRAAAKATVRKAIRRRTTDAVERTRLFSALARDTWVSDPWLSRQMRQHWKRGRNRTHNQIVVRSDQHRTFTLVEGGNVWLALPGLQRRQLVRIPLNTTVAPTGTLRLILRGGRVEVHYTIDAATVRSSRRPCGDRAVGVDKATERGDRAKARRIQDNNLGVLGRERRAAAWQCRVRDVTFRAVRAVVDKASLVVAEDLTKTFTGRKRLGKNTNRRLAAWTKGVTAEALASVSERRGSALRMVNAAYTSQVIPGTSLFGRRVGDRLHCTSCGAVWQADHAAAINVLERAADPDIGLWTPHTRVKQILQERAGRHRSRLPDQDSNTAGRCRCGERNIPSRSTLIKE